jgi:hypothetical protein
LFSWQPKLGQGHLIFWGLKITHTHTHTVGTLRMIYQHTVDTASQAVYNECSNIEHSLYTWINHKSYTLFLPILICILNHICLKLCILLLCIGLQNFCKSWYVHPL